MSLGLILLNKVWKPSSLFLNSAFPTTASLPYCGPCALMVSELNVSQAFISFFAKASKIEVATFEFSLKLAIAASSALAASLFSAGAEQANNTVAIINGMKIFFI